MALVDAWSKGLPLSLFQQKIRVVQAPQCPINVQRYLVPLACAAADCLTASCEEVSFPESMYLVEACANTTTNSDGKQVIPSSVLNKVEVLGSGPEHVWVEDEAPS